jgi:hypothetical protein
VAYYRRYTARSNSYNNTQHIVRNTQPQVTEQELTDPALLDRIKKLAAIPTLSTWEKEFLTSIGQYQPVRNRITAGQYSTMRKIEEKHSEETVAKQKSFADSFTDEMRENMKIIAGIYRETHSPFHKALVDLVLEKDGFIPSATQWERLMENKYAQGYLQNAKSIAKYNIGDTVTPSSLGKHFTWTHAIVIDNAGILPHTHAVGGKRYSLLPYGEMNTCFVEEREIKKSR